MNGLMNIKQHRDSLSPKLQILADYILAHPNDIMHMTITELAERSTCSEASIFRMCKTLGYLGFQDFKIAIAQGVSKSPTINIHDDIHPDDDARTLLEKVFNAHMRGFKETMELIDAKALEAAISLLESAPRIEFFGNGGSGSVAMDAYHKFMRIGIPCFYQTDNHFQATSVGIMPTDSVILAISHTGSNKSLIDVLLMAKTRGIKVIAITSYLKSPLSQVADITLCSPTQEIKHRPEANSSRLAQLGIVDTLYVGVSLRHQEQTLKNIDEMRHMISSQRV